MTALAVVAGVGIGVLLAECMSRALRGGAWLARRARASRESLRSFRSASTDEDRQRHLIDAGLSTLALSASVLIALALIALALAAPVFSMGWDAMQATAYMVATSIVAIAWWLWRARAPK